jgi:hypothetical protein
MNLSCTPYWYAHASIALLANSVPLWTVIDIGGPRSAIACYSANGTLDLMEHKRCGLLSDANLAGEFVRAGAVAIICDHPDCRKPLIQNNGRSSDGYLIGESPMWAPILHAWRVLR